MTEAKRGLDIKISVMSGSQKKVLAGQRAATLNRSAETIDITNKVSGGWKESIASTKEWSLDCDGVFIVDDEALGILEKAFNEGTAVSVEMSDGAWGYKGSAIITDFPVDAPYDDATTYTLTLEGTGALSKVTESLE